MSVAIRATGAALPGENGIKGNLLTGIEVLDLLLGIKKYPMRWFMPRKLKKIQTFIKRLERITGLETRNVLNDSSIKFPNTYLAVEAGKRTLEKAGISPSKVEGFVFASDTSDFVFPSPGIAVAKLLDIKPKQLVNCTMACISVADALVNACTWLEKGLCDNVLILAGDVTTRLRLPKNRIEPFIFGDGFVGIYLEKGENVTETTSGESGGFTFSNLSVDTSQAALFVHRHIYPSELRFLFNGGLMDNFQDNDTGLDLLGDIDSTELALLLKDFLDNTGGVIDENTKIVLPQTGMKTIEIGMSCFRSHTGIDIGPHVIKNDSFRKHGNIGAGAVPLAWHEARESGEIKPDSSVIFSIAGVGGVKTVFKYDPGAQYNFYFSNAKVSERPDYEALIEKKAKENADPKKRRRINNGRELTEVIGTGDNGTLDILFRPVISKIRNCLQGNGERTKDNEETNGKPKGQIDDRKRNTVS